MLDKDKGMLRFKTLFIVIIDFIKNESKEKEVFLHEGKSTSRATGKQYLGI